MVKNRKSFGVSIILLLAFMLWTIVVCTVDVQPIGPQGSSVGLASMNRIVHRLTGVNLSLYNITDWLGLVPAGICAGFGMFGLAQWIRRKSLRRVDFSLLALGGFYIVVMAAYLLFEEFVINYRPVLIEGRLEASYPSSTTMLTLCVMPTAMMQLRSRMKRGAIRRRICFAIIVFTAFMTVGRLVSGVHWFSDIVGGALLSAGLTAMYHSVTAP